MSAIITENFRRNSANMFLTSLAPSSEDNYYIGIGKADQWVPKSGITEDDLSYNITSPIGSSGDDATVKHNLATLIGVNVAKKSLIMPRVEHKLDIVHKAYNPYSNTCFYSSLIDGVEKLPCYMVNNDKIFLCLKEKTTSAPNPVSIPSSTSRTPLKLADGSIWVYLYEYTNTVSMPISVSKFLSVPTEATPDNTGILAATGNLVYGFTVIEGGIGYVSAPTVQYIDDNGDTTVLNVTIAGGAITSVSYNPVSDISTWSHHNGYITVTGGSGSGAVIYPNIAPKLGFGDNPANDLPSWYVGMNVDAIDNISGDGIYSPYRQISIIKNPEYEPGTTDFDISLRCLKRIKLDTLSSVPVNIGDIMTQVSTGARAIVDYYDNTNKYVYYHQSYSTGSIDFVVDDIVLSSITYTVDSISTSEYKHDSGDVIFVQNRKKITREDGQTEGITIILQF